MILGVLEFIFLAIISSACFSLADISWGILSSKLVRGRPGRWGIEILFAKNFRGR